MTVISTTRRPWTPPPAEGPGWRVRSRDRYRAKEARCEIFCDLVKESIAHFSRDAVVLDVGSGKGFDGNAALQQSLSRLAGQFIGVDPDSSFVPPAYFSSHYCTTLEQAPIAPASVHVAYSAFVLEHVADPRRFWGAVFDFLTPGGVFWGFTVDARSYFCLASRLLGRLNIKEKYLDSLYGARGADRYETFPTCYRANTPRQISRHTRQFSKREFLSLHRVGQVQSYFPPPLRPLSRLLDRGIIGVGMPGSILCVRLQK